MPIDNQSWDQLAIESPVQSPSFYYVPVDKQAPCPEQVIVGSQKVEQLVPKYDVIQVQTPVELHVPWPEQEVLGSQNIEHVEP
jgi:hypothetical protein